MVSGETEINAPGEQDVTSGVDEGSTSANPDLIHLTEAQLQKIRSDAAAEAGRKRKSAEVERDGLRETLAALQKERDALRDQLDSSALEAIKDDPEKVRAYNSQKALEDRERKLTEREREYARKQGELDGLMSKAKKAQFEIDVQRLSAKYNVSSEELLDMGTEDIGILEKVASKMGSAQAPQEQAGFRFEPDSGGGKRSPGHLTNFKQVENMDMDALATELEKGNKTWRTT